MYVVIGKRGRVSEECVGAKHFQCSVWDVGPSIVLGGGRWSTARGIVRRGLSGWVEQGGGGESTDSLTVHCNPDPAEVDAAGAEGWVEEGPFDLLINEISIPWYQGIREGGMKRVSDRAKTV